MTQAAWEAGAVAADDGGGRACPGAVDERVALFGLLLETTARLERRLGAALEEEMGLPLAWFEVLLRLRQAKEGYLSMTEVANQTVHSSGGTTRLVDRIESKGLVARGACPKDRRGVHLRLTDEGARTLDRALELHAAHLDAILRSRLDTGERASLTATLEKLNGGGPACGG